MSLMKNSRMGGLLLTAAFAAVLTSAQFAAAQTKATGNLYKDVMDHKDAVQWKPAPEGLLPGDVCNMMQSCSGATKVTVLVTTEGGKKITRGLFLTKSADPKHTDQVLLERQALTERYFFLLSPDGSMAKGAYLETGKAWVSIGNTVGGPTFDQDKKAWETWVGKIGAPAAPAAAAPAEAPETK